MSARYSIVRDLKRPSCNVILALLSLNCFATDNLASQSEFAGRKASVYFALTTGSDSNTTADNIAKDYGLRLTGGSWTAQSLQKRIYTAEVENIRFPTRESVDNLLASIRCDERISLIDSITEFQVAARSDRPLGRAAPDTDPYAPLQHSHVTSKITESHRISTGVAIKIAVIDTGIDAAHVDLKHQLEQQLNFVGVEQHSDTTEFHATAVAGVIGAQANNGEGIIGVAPDSRLYSLRACVENNPGSSRGKCSSVALARALDWAIVNTMQVINMSVQGQSDELVTRLINKAIEKGIVIVAATDLTNGQLSFPAKVPNVIAVSDQESNSLVGLAAHSQRIFIAPGEEILTTLPNDTYDFVTGASFAAAHVTGIVALLLEKSPNLNARAITEVLRKSVRVINWGIIVDSCAALALIEDNVNCRGFR